MAKILNPLMSAEARGKIAGIIYNTWRGISYAKIFTAPAQPQTQKQLNIRSYMTEAVRSWRSLTSAQRSGWSTYANTHTELDWTGNPRRITASNWYCRCYVLAKLLALNPITTAPTVAAPAAPAGLALTTSAGAIGVNVSTPSVANVYLDIRGYTVDSAGQKSDFKQARMLSQPVSTVTKPVTISGLPSGETAHIFVRSLSGTTFLGSPYVVSSTVVA